MPSEIRQASATIESKATYPQTPLARDLKLVAKLIASGMPTRIYYVKLGGFDTHANQCNATRPCWINWAVASPRSSTISNSSATLDRVTLMTFSEFGRRVKENGSGTDHGEAAPMFLAGGRIKAGFHGTFPGRRRRNSSRGDVAFTTDFRRVYASSAQWLAGGG